MWHSTQPVDGAIQIERAKGEAELGRLKHVLLEMRKDTDELAGSLGAPPMAPNLASNGPNDVVMTNVEVESVGGRSTPPHTAAMRVSDADGFAGGEGSDDDSEAEVSKDLYRTAQVDLLSRMSVMTSGR